jgi:hypothetical protein
MTTAPEALKSADTPPEGSTPLVQALWQTAHGGWDAAHEIVQADESADAAWVHAHLHRVEGDLSNAAYWYKRAGKPVCDASLDDEWAALVQAFG